MVSQLQQSTKACSKTDCFRIGFIALAALILPPQLAQAQDPDAGAATEEANASKRLIDYSKIDEYYDIFAVKKGDRRNFRFSAMTGQAQQVSGAYLNFMSNLKPSTFPENEQLAYWLNLRNLLVMRAIASDNPGRSLKKARGTFEKPGEMWTRKRLAVEGQQMSIHDIEANYLTSKWTSPDILYGMYQGVQGGPALTSPATFDGPNVWKELEERGRYYVNSRKSISVKGEQAKVSEVYAWYKDTLFEGDDAKLLQHLQKNADGKLAPTLSDATSISFRKMNYKLDAVPAPSQRSGVANIPRSGGFTGGGGS